MTSIGLKLSNDHLLPTMPVMQTMTIALSIKPGGSARRIAVSGGLITHGTGISPVELHGNINSLEITDGLTAAGGGFEKL
jgi:hypothetical protein